MARQRGVMRLHWHGSGHHLPGRSRHVRRWVPSPPKACEATLSEASWGPAVAWTCKEERGKPAVFLVLADGTRAYQESCSFPCESLPSANATDNSSAAQSDLHPYVGGNRQPLAHMQGSRLGLHTPVLFCTILCEICTKVRTQPKSPGQLPRPPQTIA